MDSMTEIYAMSIEKEDLRLKMDADMMERLRLIADVRGNEVGKQGSMLLDKMIMAEFHEVSLMLERADKNKRKREELGLLGQSGESQALKVLNK